MSALDAFLGRTVFAPIAGVRTYLLLKGTLLLVAFDVWLTRVSHGGRYGAGGFNVAHFAWLDAIQPDVSPALYVGVSTLTGFLCLALALAPRPPRWLLALAFLLYTWGWAMSMLDSYQHHYLLSIVLLALIFFPRLSAEEALLPREPKPALEPAPKKTKKKRKKTAPAPAKPPPLFTLRPPTFVAWAYVTLAVSVAIVYAYAAFSKTSESWLTGVAMRSVLRLPASGEAPDGAFDPVAPVRGLASMVGIEGESFWGLLGYSVVLVQLVCAAGYLLAPLRDSARSAGAATPQPGTPSKSGPSSRARASRVRPSIALSVFSWIALATALAFHLGAEHMQLKIGWFSWYMALYAVVMLLPAQVLAALLRATLPLAGRAFSAELLAVRICVGLVVTIVGLVAYANGYEDLLRSEGARRFAGAFLDPAVILSLGLLLLLATPLRIVLHALDHHARLGSAHYALVSVAVGALAMVAAGYAIDLPGARAAGVIGACALGAGAVGLLVLRGHAHAIHPYGVSALVGAAAFFLVVWQSDVRFDFWRNVGGDGRRRGEVATAYEAYVKANCYAPPGEDRDEKEEEMRRALEDDGLALPDVECTLARDEADE